MKNDTCIRIIGAKQNNLKNLSLNLPRGQLIAVTGVSGSGKSSLALETLYAEGQRRSQGPPHCHKGNDGDHKAFLRNGWDHGINRRPFEFCPAVFAAMSKPP